MVDRRSATDKADEIVMLGGHLHSWHSGTGATDNSAGPSIMLEAAPVSIARPEAAPHHSRGSVVRRRRGIARFAGLRRAAFRHCRKSQARMVQAGRAYFNIATGTGTPRATRNLRAAGGR